jgi:tetratricopeptide (TPR) repeat protein
MLADALYLQGRYEEAERFVAASEEAADAASVPGQVWWRLAKAKLLAHGGEHADAEALAREATKMASGIDQLNICGDASLTLAKLLLESGRPGEAIEPAGEAVRAYELKGNVVSAARASAVLEELNARV